VDGYRQFWNRVFYGTDDVAVGVFDVSDYWIRLFLVVALGILAGIASRRFSWLAGGLTGVVLALYALSVGPFLVWAASCGGCGSSFSYDTARSYEAMLINVWWGSVLATAIAAIWLGVWAGRRFL
jgi:hypothetical protein